jgi:branched-chain amino acid transport system permease protein
MGGFERAKIHLREGARYCATPVALSVVVIVIVKTAALSADLEQRAATLLVSLVVVIGLSMLVSNSGVLSFGHVSFVAIGAYVSALLTVPASQKSILLPDLPTWLGNVEIDTASSALIAGGVCAAIAVVVGVPMMRLSGIAASIATLALLVIVHDVSRNWDAVTGGNQTMVVSLDTTVDSALPWVVAFIVLAWVFQESRWGVKLQAARDDEVAAVALGINPTRQRLIAFVLSAFAAGVGGALYAHLLGAFGPSTFYLSITFVTIAMLVIGGMYSLTGAVAGAVVVSVLTELLRRAELGVNVGPLDLPARPGLQEVGTALVMLLILLLRPEGLFTGKGRSRWRKGAARSNERLTGEEPPPILTTRAASAEVSESA